MYPFPYGQNFSTSIPQYGNDLTPTNVQESPLSQFSTFDSRDVIDLNENNIEVEEIQDIRDNNVQWKWEEDKLLIRAWLNVSIDPLVGTDQKGDTFWERIHQYCEESDPGLIKRGTVAIRKRWQRINEGAQKYGACFEKAQKIVGSGSNMDDIIEKAHLLHKTHYGKKCNFDKHWSELANFQNSPVFACVSLGGVKNLDMGVSPIAVALMSQSFIGLSHRIDICNIF